MFKMVKKMQNSDLEIAAGLTRPLSRKWDYSILEQIHMFGID